MEYALSQGYTFVTFVSSIYMLEHGTAVGWKIIRYTASFSIGNLTTTLRIVVPATGPEQEGDG